MGDSQGQPDERPFEAVFYPTERVPLVAWREISGAKPAVILLAALTVIGFVTGLSNLSQAVPTLDGPIASTFPIAETFVRFAGVVLAFPLGLITVGLQRRKRIAWWGGLLIQPPLLLLPLVTGSATDFPLFVLSLASIPLLIVNRSTFDQRLHLSSFQIASLASILGVGIYGTVGAYGLRGQFLRLDGWGDAFYYVIVTIATVGYGDITPVTLQAKLFSLSVILFGTGAFTVAIGALIGPAIESRMAAAFGTMTASELSLLEDHIVVLGHGDVTASFIEHVSEDDVVVVTANADAASRLADAGIEVLTDDPTDEAALRDARVNAAKAVAVAGDDDARNVLGVLATRNVNPDVHIVAVANEEMHVEKLRAVGADDIIDLHAIGGRLLSESVLRDRGEQELTGGEESGRTHRSEAADRDVGASDGHGRDRSERRDGAASDDTETDPET